ncbi:MAG: hypothetical protein GX195_11750 [Firmicutes bacterium]|jgi:hypothetical protein|nr:hypothetical protein [Bacillota bacterium]
MQGYVYRAAVEYQSSSEMLETIRAAVQRLKAENPQLRSCQLADVGLKRGKHAVSVTLFFRPNIS